MSAVLTVEEVAAELRIGRSAADQPSLAVRYRRCESGARFASRATRLNRCLTLKMTTPGC